jgi:hypothetical protein
VKSFARGLGLALVVAGMLGVTGCSPDNESEASRAKPLGDSGLKTEKGDASEPVPKTQAEWFKQQQAKDPYKAKGYPGTQNKK